MTTHRGLGPLMLGLAVGAVGAVGAVVIVRAARSGLRDRLYEVTEKIVHRS